VTTLPVNVVFSVRRDVEVQNHVHVRNIQASGGHVCRYENVPLPRLELVERAQPLGLGELSVQAHRVEAQVAQQQRHAQGVVAGGHEYDDGLPFKLVQQVGEVAVFVLGRNEQILLHKGLKEE
jgi:hypothetical protein